MIVYYLYITPLCVCMYMYVHRCVHMCAHVHMCLQKYLIPLLSSLENLNFSQCKEIEILLAFISIRASQNKQAC